MWSKIKSKFRAVRVKGRKGSYDIPQPDKDDATLAGYRHHSDTAVVNSGIKKLNQNEVPCVISDKDKSQNNDTVEKNRNELESSTHQLATTNINGHPTDTQQQLAEAPISHIAKEVPFHSADRREEVILNGDAYDPYESIEDVKATIQKDLIKNNGSCVDDDEDDPAYATLGEVKKQVRGVADVSTSSLTTDYEPTPVSSKEKSQEQPGPSQVESLTNSDHTKDIDSIKTELFQNSAVKLRKRFSSSTSDSLRPDSCSEFPTYDNWELKTDLAKQRQRNSASEFPSYDNWVFKNQPAICSSPGIATPEKVYETIGNPQPSNETTLTTSITSNDGDLDELYARPRGRGTSEDSSRGTSRDSSAERMICNPTEDCPTHGSDHEEPPPVPDRKYERTVSLLEKLASQGALEPLQSPCYCSESSKESDETQKVKQQEMDQIHNDISLPEGSDIDDSHDIENKTNSKPYAPNENDNNNSEAPGVLDLSSHGEVLVQAPADTEDAHQNTTTTPSSTEHMHASESSESTETPQHDELLQSNGQTVSDKTNLTNGNPLPISATEEPIHMSLEEVRQQRIQLGIPPASPVLNMSPTTRRKIQEQKKNCIDSLWELKDIGWYWGPLSGQEAVAKLADKPEGSFLVRDSSDERYILSLSFKSQDGVHHTRIEHHKGKFSFYAQPDSHGHDSITAFIEKIMHHSRNQKFLYFMRPPAPHQPPTAIVLLHPVSRFQSMRSLQHMCRFVILKLARRDHIDVLPLPAKTKDYLKQAQYYTEELGEA